MKKYLLVLPLCLIMLGSFAQVDRAKHYAEMVTGDAFKKQLTIKASAEMQGRELVQRANAELLPI